MEIIIRVIKRLFLQKVILRRWQLNLMAVLIFTLGILFAMYVLTEKVILPKIFAASSPWIQTDWSGGQGISNDNQYESASGIDATGTAGQISLSATAGWSATYANWSRRKALTVNNSLGSTLTDYQTKVTLAYDSDMQADFDDVRFTDSSGTALNYWLDHKTDSTSAVFWVKATLANGDNTLYAYYGNAGASSASNGANTFVFYDDFPGSSLDSNKWGTAGTTSDITVNNKLVMTAGGCGGWNRSGLYSKTDFDRTNGYITELRYKPTGWTSPGCIDNGAVMFGWLDNSGGTNYTNLVHGIYDVWTGDSNTIYEKGGGTSPSAPYNTGLTIDQLYEVKITALPSAAKGAKYYLSTDNGENYTNFYSSSTYGDSPLKLGFSEYNQNFEIYNWRIRKYATAEPTLTVGNEANKYPASATLTSNVFDAGFSADWGTLTYTTGGSGTVTVKVRTSDSATMDGATAWVSCAAKSSGADLTGGCVNDMDRYVQYQVILEPAATSTPTFSDISIAFTASDTQAPDVNASEVTLVGLTSGSWTNAKPTVTWRQGEDNAGGIGLLGYCLSLDEVAVTGSETSHLLDPASSGGILNGLNDGIVQDYCDFIVAEASGTTESIDLTTIAGLTLHSNKHYYLSVKAVDLAGNIYADNDYQDLVDFKFDGDKPTPPVYFSLPGDFISTKSATLIWPAAGDDAAADTGGSGFAGLQYRIGASGTWYGDSHNGRQDLTDLLVNDGAYATRVEWDFTALSQGSNQIFIRALDNAGNISQDAISGTLKINSVAPSTPRNLIVAPTDNTINSYSFSWNDPSVITGQAAKLTYCYTINTVPSATSCSFTAADANSLGADAYATQPGKNILYLVAKDEAGNINYDTYASAEFSYSGSAPGIPRNMDVADISIKASSNWKLTASWDVPSSLGAGISSYKVYRGTSNAACSSLTYIGSTSGTSYTDTGLAQAVYYYCVKACDSANNCGAGSTVVSGYPDGKYTSAASLSSGPTTSSITAKKATISWGTDRKSDSKVQFGTKSGSYNTEEPSNSTQVTDHTINLTNLSPGTTYYYKAKWTDEDGNTGTSEEKNFTTDPAPKMKEISAKNIGLASVILQFTAKGATKVKIYYGTTTAFGGVKEISTSTTETTYTAEIGGLTDDTKYFFKINGFDSDGTEYDGDINSFTTLPRPKISSVRFQEVKGTASPTVLVTWTTNTEVSSIVTYYPEGDTGKAQDEVSVALTRGTHRMVIKGLLANTPYTLVVKGRDKAGNEAVSDAQRFTTASDTRPPQILNLKIEGTTIPASTGQESQAQLVVSWDTDEPSSSQVEFGEGTGDSYAQKTQEDTNLTLNHLVVISNLTPAKVYHLKALSRDKGGNRGESIDTVTITPKSTTSALDLVVGNLSEVFTFLGR